MRMTINLILIEWRARGVWKEGMSMNEEGSTSNLHSHIGFLLMERGLECNSKCDYVNISL